VGIVTGGGTKNEDVAVTDLDHFLEKPISMLSVIVVGNSSTEVIKGRMVTRRGYRL
jgi:precorrin-3B methylase